MGGGLFERGGGLIEDLRYIQPSQVVREVLD